MKKVVIIVSALFVTAILSLTIIAATLPKEKNGAANEPLPASATGSDSFETIIKDPSSGITDAEAAAIALNYAKELYGEKITSFDIIGISGDDYQATVIAAEPYEGADFTVYGSRCTTRVMRDGSVDFCICGNPVPVDAEKLSGISRSILESYVQEMIESRFDGIIKSWEMTEIRAGLSEENEPVLRLFFTIELTEIPEAELTEGLAAAQSLDPVYAGYYEYPIG